MSVPPLLLAATLMFWGWQTELWLAAVPLALVFELARVAHWRWDLNRQDFNRLADLSTVLLLGITLYHLGGGSMAHAVLAVFQWLPLSVAPLLAGQLYSGAGRVPVSSLFLTLRRLESQGRLPPSATLDLGFPFVAMALLSASTANSRSLWFFPCVATLVGWALWGVRGRRRPAWLWPGAMLLAVAIGYGGQLGLHALQRSVESVLVQWLQDLLAGDTDPYRARTSIGDIGVLKLSDRIVLRVHAPAMPPGGLLLREASYDTFRYGTWLAPGVTFSALRPQPPGDRWPLAQDGGTAEHIQIAVYLRHGRGILPLPTGALQLDHLPALDVERNMLGTVRVGDGPDFVNLDVRFRAAGSDGPPRPSDLTIPDAYGEVVERIATALGLGDMAPGRVPVRLAQFFFEDFRYSLVLGSGRAGATPLQEFLERSRAGHCEYFATATVLLLRQAGIPARYTTGYTVREHGVGDDEYVVRRRHAHAWALAYVDGRWLNVDTTPPDWPALEDARASVWQPLEDLWSWLGFRYSQWRWSERDPRGNAALGWLLIPLFAILVWRLYGRRRVERGRRHQAEALQSRPGVDSPLWQLLTPLLARGLGPRRNETLGAWLNRVTPLLPASASPAELRILLELHYALRFGSPESAEAARIRLTRRLAGAPDT